MTGLENSIKGTAFYITEEGEYKELGTIKTIETEEPEEYTNIIQDTEADFEYTITDKETIRRLKQLCKTDKDKKAERRFNKNSFRNFINRKRGKII